MLCRVIAPQDYDKQFRKMLYLVLISILARAELDGGIDETFNKAYQASLHSYRLSQITRLVYIRTLQHRNVIRQ